MHDHHIRVQTACFHARIDDTRLAYVAAAWCYEDETGRFCLSPEDGAEAVAKALAPQPRWQEALRWAEGDPLGALQDLVTDCYGIGCPGLRPDEARVVAEAGVWLDLWDPDEVGL